jgi:hypothetical protein
VIRKLDALPPGKDAPVPAHHGVAEKLSELKWKISNKRKWRHSAETPLRHGGQDMRRWLTAC